MKLRQIAGLVLAGLLLIGFSVVVYPRLQKATSEIGETLTAEGALQEFTLLVADNTAERVQGLSGRESFATDHAMLFVFDKSDHWSIWMKDMKFPIDIVWLDESRRVTHIAPSVSPDTYPTKFRPPVPSKYVVEFNAGVAQELGLAVGTQLEF